MAEGSPTSASASQTDTSVDSGPASDAGLDAAPLDAPAPAAGLLGRLRALLEWLDRELWLHDPDPSRLIHGLRSLAQLIVLTARGFKADQLLLRASALTYVTALSVIPLLGVVIAVLSLVGGNEVLVNFAIEQLTTVAPEVRQQVRDYAAGLDLTRFGTVGGVIVFGTAVFALRHLERTLNDIWGVARNRGWARRFADYLAVLIVAPISAGLAISLATTLESATVVARLLEDPAFARLYGLGLSQLPVLVLFLGFTFLFWFFPNTSVKISAAALGGLVSAVLFSAARTIYVGFQVGAATYQTLFGALSAVPLILIWLYACWAILLLGAEVAFATQNLPFARREMRAGEVSSAEREAITLEIAVAIGREFRDRCEPPTADHLADLLDEPVRLVRRLVDELEAGGLLRAVIPRDGGDIAFVPARPLGSVSVGDVLRAVRGKVDPGVGRVVVRSPEVAQTLSQLNRAWQHLADDTPIEALLRGEAAPPARPEA